MARWSCRDCDHRGSNAVATVDPSVSLANASRPSRIALSFRVWASSVLFALRLILASTYLFSALGKIFMFSNEVESALLLATEPITSALHISIGSILAVFVPAGEFVVGILLFSSLGSSGNRVAL